MKETTLANFPRIIALDEDAASYAAFMKVHGTHNGTTTIRRINGTRITSTECIEHRVTAKVRVTG